MSGTYSRANIKSQIIDTQNDIKNRRCIFVLDDNTHYLNNFRLLDIGVTSTDGGAAEYYNFLAGVPVLIRKLTLLSNGVELDSIDHFNLYTAFKNYNRSNDENRDKFKHTLGHNLGFTFDGDTGTAPESKIRAYYGSSVIRDAANEALTKRGYIDLRSCFDFLRQVNFVNTTEKNLPNFRVIVEYETDLKSVRVNGQTLANNSTLQPLLVVDKIIDPVATMNYTMAGFTFKGWDNDRVNLPAMTPTASDDSPAQNVTFKISGFNNKRLGRLLMINRSLQDSVTENKKASFGSMASYANNKESIQLAVNGSNLLPRPLTSKAQKLDYLDRFFGTCDHIVGSNDVGFYDSGNYINNEDYIGSLDYFGMRIDKGNIDDLQLQYGRVGAYDSTLPANQQYKNPVNQEQQLVFYGEVDKEIVRAGNKWVVVYVKNPAVQNRL